MQSNYVITKSGPEFKKGKFVKGVMPEWSSRPRGGEREHNSIKLRYDIIIKQNGGLVAEYSLGWKIERKDGKNIGDNEAAELLVQLMNEAITEIIAYLDTNFGYKPTINRPTLNEAKYFINQMG
jgi:hypothetical protein